MDGCRELKRIIADMIPHIPADPVPKNDVGAQMTMERGKVLDRVLLVDIDMTAAGMGMHTKVLTGKL